MNTRYPDEAPTQKNSLPFCHKTFEPELPRGVLGLVTRRQLAQILQVSVGTIDRWRRDGVIPHFFIPGGAKKSKGVVRFRIDEVLEALGRFRVGSATSSSGRCHHD